MESIADLLLGSSVGVGWSALHVGNGSGSSLDDALEAIDDIAEAGTSTARAGSEKRNTVHGVEVFGDGGEALGLLSDLFNGLYHCVGGDLTLLDGTGCGSGGKKGHDGSEK